MKKSSDVISHQDMKSILENAMKSGSHKELKMLIDDFNSYSTEAFLAIDSNKMKVLSSVEDLVSLNPEYEGQSVFVLSRISSSGSKVGSGVFYWNGGFEKTKHNGGTIISNTVPYDDDVSNFNDAIGEIDPSGNGCWISKNNYVTPSMFGGVPDDESVDNNKALQSFILCDNKEKVFDGMYHCDGELQTNTGSDGIQGVVFKGMGMNTGISIYGGEFTVFRPVNVKFENMKLYGSSVARPSSGLPNRSTSNNFFSLAFRNESQGDDAGVICDNVIIDVFKYRIGRINKDSYSSSITRCTFRDSTFKSKGDELNAKTCGGFRVQTSKDGNVDQQHTFDNLTVIVDDSYRSDIGLEIWTGNCIVGNCKIISPLRNGGYSGIVSGTGPLTRVVNNFVYGFGAGVEIGDTGLLGCQIISNNVFWGCSYGVTLTTSGQERNILVNSNVTIFDDEHIPRDGHLVAYRTKSPGSIISNNVAIHYKSIEGNGSPLDYNDPGYFAGTGMYFNTKDEFPQCSGNYFEGLEKGIVCDGLAKAVTVAGCTFSGVKYPLAGSGSPAWLFSNNIVKNFYALRNNNSISASNNMFYRSDDFEFLSGRPIEKAPWVQSTVSQNTKITGFGNNFNNVNGFCSVPDSFFPESGVGAGRPNLEIYDGMVINVSDTFSMDDIKANAVLVGEEVVGRMARSLNGTKIELITPS